MGFCKKRWVFPKKNVKISKNADGSKFEVECHRNSKFFKTLKHWAIQNNRRFFLKKTWIFWKQLKLANWMSNANGTIWFLRTLRSWVFWKKRCVSRKKPWIFQKSLILTYAVECDGISKFSQKPQNNLSCFEKKGGFFKKNQFFENG